MTPRQVRKFCPLKPESMSLLKAAMEDLGLSARAHDKVLRVARTIADLDGNDDIKPQNIAEAVGYRSLELSYLRVHRTLARKDVGSPEAVWVSRPETAGLECKT